MSRKVVSSVDEARQDVTGPFTRPPWMERQHSFPFGSLTPDEFELFAYLLLSEEREVSHQPQKLYYYGKTGDAGRDVIADYGDGRVELIQCKRFEENVGVGIVREELAKLCNNIHTKKIEPAPTAVVFYLSNDLSAHAQDLLKSKDKWLSVAARALEEHLGELPAPELLDFARSWWPEISWQTGTQLTQRARKLTTKRLTEEFFDFKSVVVGNIDTFDARLKEMERKVELGIQLQLEGANKGMQELVARYEALNPGLTFIAQVTGATTAFMVRPRPDAKDITYGTLEFPETDAGRNGAAKFAKAMNEGRPVELADDECSWKSALKRPSGDVVPTRTSVRISPQVPDREAAVRLDCEENGGVSAGVSLAFMRLVRVGRREVEFRVYGGNFAAEFVFILKSDGSATGRLSTNLGRTRAALSRATVDLLLALSRGALLRVISLEQETPLFETGLTGLPIADVDLNWIRNLLLQISKVNKELGVDIRYPNEVPDARSCRLVRLLAEAIDKGRVREGSLRATLRLSVPVDAALKMIEGWKRDADVSVAVGNYLEATAFGVELDFGSNHTEMLDVSPAVPLEEVERLVQSAAGENVELDVICVQMEHVFDRWTEAAQMTQQIAATSTPAQHSGASDGEPSLAPLLRHEVAT